MRTEIPGKTIGQTNDDATPYGGPFCQYSEQSERKNERDQASNKARVMTDDQCQNKCSYKAGCLLEVA
jgi:hypothetical protein